MADREKGGGYMAAAEKQACRESGYYQDANAKCADVAEPGQVMVQSQTARTRHVSCSQDTVVMGEEHVPRLRNHTLEREKQGCYSVLSYTTMFVFVDIWRQLTAYGMKYYNQDVYPIAQTQVVVVGELIKLFVFLWRLLQAGKLTSIKMSPLYFMPSFIYAINSNIFFYAMHYTTPPIWNVLTQLRVIFTAIMYRLVFKRKISWVQWAALVMLTAAIVLPDFGDTNPEENNTEDIVMTVVLAVAASMLTAMGPLYTEVSNLEYTRHWPEVGLMLVQRRRQCTNNKPTSSQWLVFAGNRLS